MSQSSLWQIHTESGQFAELCNGLYQREINLIAKEPFNSVQAVQIRLKSLPYYINKTAHAMIQVMADKHSPLTVDFQNATWSAKQSQNMPVPKHETTQEQKARLNWYLQNDICVGLVVPVLVEGRIFLDCIDRVEFERQRIRTNASGWFSLDINVLTDHSAGDIIRILKPNKKIMTSACIGQCWQSYTKQQPSIPSLRELLLSCAINWTNFKKPLAI